MIFDLLDGVALINRKQNLQMRTFNRKRAAKSIVTVYRTKEATGMGVLVQDEFILTAAHCLPRLPDPDDPFGDIVRVTFHPFGSSDCSAAWVMSADPCSDMAILGNRTVRGSDMDSEAVGFEKCLRSLTSAPLCLDDIKPRAPIRVHVLSHLASWLTGEIISYASERPFYELTIDKRHEPVQPGTSGSPVFDNGGRIVGIMSNASCSETWSATVVRLPLALPGWFLQMLNATTA